jgi:DNA-binding CsgD family transcriptional regulator
MGSPKVPDGCPLTPRQFEIARLLAGGLTPRSVARNLGRSPQTIYNAVHAACAILQIDGGSRALVAEVGARGWVGWEPPIDPATPLAVDAPFLAAYLREFERSRWPNEPDTRSVIGMRLALAGHRNTLTEKE